MDNLFATHTGLALGYEGLKKYNEAAQHFKSAIDVTEQIRDGLNDSQRTNFYNVRIQGFARIAPYEGLCRVLIQMGQSQESFRLAEATRARIFAEQLSSRAQDASFDVPKSIVDRDADITNRLAALSQGLQKAYEKGSKEAIESLEKQVKELGAERDAHVSKLRKEYPLFAATKYPQPMGLDESALKDDEWVLEYEVTDSGVAVYLVKGKKIVKSIFKPIPRKELDDLVRKFREPMEMAVSGRDKVNEKLKAFDFTSGKTLSDLLLGDVLPELPPGEPVIVVPDDSLGVLPFEMLVLNSGGEVKTDKTIPFTSGAEFLSDRNPISYYQSVTALTLARTLGKKTRPGERMLVMADPVYKMKDQRAQKASGTKVASGPERLYSDLMAAMEQSGSGSVPFDRLPLTGDLTERLSTMFSGKVQAYTGLDASKQNFLGKIVPKLGEYRSIVFATHGYFGTRLPGILEPVLVLTTVPYGTDGFLRMSEVMGCRMSADVVALTACQTGLGRNISGEGTMGMGRAFQYAGAKSVIMSLWAVSETSSVRLVESFFKNLSDGKGKLEALKLARDEVRKDGFDHPFFWAPFILVGETD